MPKRPEAMDCPAVLERLEAHVDGDLAGAEAVVVDAHLEGCPACAVEHDLALAVQRELRALPELDAPPAVLREIAREAERSRFRKPPRVAVTWRPAVAAAALFAAVIGGSLWWGDRGVQAPPEPAVDTAAVARATEEARIALAYLNRAHRRAGLKLRDDLFANRVARPTARGLARSLSARPEHGTVAVEDSGAVGSDRS